MAKYRLAKPLNKTHIKSVRFAIYHIKRMVINTTDGPARLDAQKNLDRLSEVYSRLMVSIAMKPLDFDNIINGKNLSDIATDV